MVRVGVVSTSWWADSMYLPALQAHPQADVVAVCARNYDRLREFADRWDIAEIYTDYREMIQSGKIDAVIVASANDSHYPITMEALNARLHVLCDKPLALETAQAHEMAKLATETGVKNMVPFTYRYMPTNRYVKQLLDEGYIGKPYHLNMRYYAGYGREQGYLWRFDADAAGSGVIGDLGAHWLHLARWYFGEVVGLSCYLETFIDRPDRPDGQSYTRADDSAALTVRFENGAYGLLQVTTVAWEGTKFNQTHHMEFHGSDGTLYNYVDWDATQQVKGAKAGQPPQMLDVPDSIWNGIRRDTVHNTYKDVFRDQNHMTREFITAIINDHPVYPDFNEGLRVQELIDAAIQSARANSCWVEV